jgi:hypothetical protein
MMKAKKVIVLKNGVALKAGNGKARKFASKAKADNFIVNLTRVATKQHLTRKNFELIEV